MNFSDDRVLPHLVVFEQTHDMLWGSSYNHPGRDCMVNHVQ